MNLYYFAIYYLEMPAFEKYKVEAVRIIAKLAALALEGG